MALLPYRRSLSQPWNSTRRRPMDTTSRRKIRSVGRTHPLGHHFLLRSFPRGDI